MNYNANTTENDLLEDSYYITQAQVKTLEDFLGWASSTINLRNVKKEVLEDFYATCHLALEDSQVA